MQEPDTEPQTGETERGNHKLSSRIDEIKAEARTNAAHMERSAVRAAESEKRTLVGRGSAVAEAVRRLGDELDDNQEPWLGDVARQLAEGVHRTSRRLEQRTVQELTDDVRSLSKYPVVFLGGAFTLGLLAGRFLRASEAHGYDDGDDRPTVPRPDVVPPLKPARTVPVTTPYEGIGSQEGIGHGRP